MAKHTASSLSLSTIGTWTLLGLAAGLILPVLGLSSFLDAIKTYQQVSDIPIALTAAQAISLASDDNVIKVINVQITDATLNCDDFVDFGRGRSAASYGLVSSPSYPNTPQAIPLATFFSYHISCEKLKSVPIQGFLRLKPASNWMKDYLQWCWPSITTAPTQVWELCLNCTRRSTWGGIVFGGLFSGFMLLSCTALGFLHGSLTAIIDRTLKIARALPNTQEIEGNRVVALRRPKWDLLLEQSPVQRHGLCRLRSIYFSYEANPVILHIQQRKSGSMFDRAFRFLAGPGTGDTALDEKIVVKQGSSEQVKSLIADPKVRQSFIDQQAWFSFRLEASHVNKSDFRGRLVDLPDAKVVLPPGANLRDVVIYSTNDIKSEADLESQIQLLVVILDQLERMDIIRIGSHAQAIGAHPIYYALRTQQRPPIASHSPF